MPIAEAFMARNVTSVESVFLPNDEQYYATEDPICTASLAWLMQGGAISPPTAKWCRCNDLRNVMPLIRRAAAYPTGATGNTYLIPITVGDDGRDYSKKLFDEAGVAIHRR